jgi:60 kDa SS-A/Ro ribonucleoprotein
MQWAMKHSIQADAFVVLTDSDTWQGFILASQALNMYRQKFNTPARLVVVGMTATQFSIAGPNDAGSLDV